MSAGLFRICLLVLISSLLSWPTTGRLSTRTASQRPPSRALPCMPFSCLQRWN